MAKNQNTFAKRQREMDKKRKAEEKRARRKHKEVPNHNAAATSPEAMSDGDEGSAVEPQ